MVGVHVEGDVIEAVTPLRKVSGCRIGEIGMVTVLIHFLRINSERDKIPSSLTLLTPHKKVLYVLLPIPITLALFIHTNTPSL